MVTRPAVRLGFWASVILAGLGAIYLVLLVASVWAQGFTMPQPPLVQSIGGLVTIPTACTILVIFAAIRELTPPEKVVYGTVALGFAILFVAMVSINRFVQLTVVRFGEGSVDLARFLPYSPESVMYALEMLGWGFFLSLACLAISPLFGGSTLQRWIRWLLLLFALFSFMSVAGYATATSIGVVAFVAWGPILLVIAVLLVIVFRRNEYPQAI